MFDDIDLSRIRDENVRELVRRLLNLGDKLSVDLQDVQTKIQCLCDEVNRLKDEQGEPKIKGGIRLCALIAQNLRSIISFLQLETIYEPE